MPRHPGERVHLNAPLRSLGSATTLAVDVKLSQPDKPGHRTLRTGCEAVHVCIDDTSRMAYVEVLPNEKADTTVAFIARAVAWFAERGIIVERVMSDNGAPYVSTAWRTWCADHNIRHLRTRPYRPRTNGKAERFIQTMLR